MANSSKNAANEVEEVELGEIGTIRDILMGHHIQQYDAQLEQMQEEIDFLRAQLEQKIEEVDKFHKLSTLDLKKNANQRLNKLEKQLAKQVDSLENKIQTVSTVDKKEMGKMMANISKKLMGE